MQEPTTVPPSRARLGLFALAAALLLALLTWCYRRARRARGEPLTEALAAELIQGGWDPREIRALGRAWVDYNAQLLTLHVFSAEHGRWMEWPRAGRLRMA